MQLVRNWSDSRLRASIETTGPILPVYRLGSEIVDGRRRDQFARAVGKPCQIYECKTEQRALQVLWQQHPDRALQRMGSGTLLTYAKALDVPLSEVAQVLHKLRPRNSRDVKRVRERYRGTKPVLVNTLMTPTLRAMVQMCSAREGGTIAHCIRRALLQRIKDTLTVQEIESLWRELRAFDVGPLGDEMVYWVSQLQGEK